MSDLTEKQKKFVEEYLIDLNATQAGIRSGYSKDTARSIGSENLTKPDIQEAIGKRRAEIAEASGITPEKIASELAKLGFANMQDFIRVTGEGDPYFDLSDLTRDQAAALVEVTVEDFKDGRGDDARDVRRIKFRLADKRSALVDLGKHLGMFKDSLELKGRVTLTHEQVLEQLAAPDDATRKGDTPPISG